MMDQNLNNVSEYLALDHMALKSMPGTSIPKEKIRLNTNGAAVTGIIEKENYAVIEGSIYPVDPSAPEIRFHLLTPCQWNRRTVQMGGGANNGKIPNVEGPLIMSGEYPCKKGYVVLGDDSGHQSEDVMSADFAANEESLENYIREHLIKTHDVMKALLPVLYGQNSVKDYFAGASTGGREALECATTYGDSYDGVFCGDPSSSYVLIRLWGAILSQTVYQNYDPIRHPHSDGFISEEIIHSIQHDAIERYDELDGIKDGIISNIYAARAQREDFLGFIKEKYHLSDSQVETLKIYEEGFTLPYSMPNGMNSYHGYAALEGGAMDLGPDEVPREPLDTRYNVHHGDRADGVFKYFITKDPHWKLMDHDYYHPDEKLYQMLMDASRKYDANGPAFDSFIHHGGKLILFTSWNDMSISPWQIIQQYRGYIKKYGDKTVRSFLKFFIMPSATHCNGIKMNYLSWLDQWCSNGQYPEEDQYAEITATNGTMPMAEFPGWIKYKGGDPADKDSYTISYEIPEGFFGKFD